MTRQNNNTTDSTSAENRTDHGHESTWGATPEAKEAWADKHGSASTSDRRESSS